jgi:hypothetical protein
MLRVSRDHPDAGHPARGDPAAWSRRPALSLSLNPARVLLTVTGQ